MCLAQTGKAILGLTNEFKAFLYKTEKQAVHVMPMCFFFLVTLKYRCVIDSKDIV